MDLWRPIQNPIKNIKELLQSNAEYCAVDWSCLVQYFTRYSKVQVEINIINVYSSRSDTTCSTSLRENLTLPTRLLQKFRSYQEPFWLTIDRSKQVTVLGVRALLTTGALKYIAPAMSRHIYVKKIKPRHLVYYEQYSIIDEIDKPSDAALRRWKQAWSSPFFATVLCYLPVSLCVESSRERTW